jgi:hypothetical protein
VASSAIAGFSVATGVSVAGVSVVTGAELSTTYQKQVYRLVVDTSKVETPVASMVTAANSPPLASPPTQ